jgi:hypothetical protein
MDDKDFEATKKLLLSINEVVTKMDPAVRVSVFDLLVSRYLGKENAAPAITPAAVTTKGQAPKTPADTSDLGAFISSLDTKKPADAVIVLVGWLYSQYGTYAITTKEVKELADSCGLTIPSRADNTMRQAKDKGKALFTQQGKGWKLTVSGELYLKETYMISKGNKSLPTE